jgi:hypothetical protein
VNDQLSRVSSGRCDTDWSCALPRQAMIMDNIYSGSAGFAYMVSSLRLAEVSMTYNMPRVLARRVVGAQSASVTLAGRNLALWTNYGRKDPDIGNQEGDYPRDGLDNATSYGQPKSWTVRLTVGF